MITMKQNRQTNRPMDTIFVSSVIKLYLSNTVVLILQMKINRAIILMEFNGLDSVDQEEPMYYHICIWCFSNTLEFYKEFYKKKEFYKDFAGQI